MTNHRQRSATSCRAAGSFRLLGLLVLLTAVLTAGAPSVIRIGWGDTLGEVAQRHHTTVARLIALNHLPGNGTIYAGELLRLPAEEPLLRPYAVRRGDTLTGLAQRFGTTTADLRSRNHLSGTLLQIGQHLVVAVPRTAGPRTDVPAPVVHVPDAVQQSVTRHRQTLAGRSRPSRGQVRRMIAASARRHGVDVSFALAVAYQESGFQQQVVSPVDAIGVMQVLPSTGRALEQAFGRRFDLLTAGDNIEAGVLLLRQLLASTADWRGALAGYYQGLGSLQAQGMLPQTHAYIRSIAFLRPRFRQG